jgi:hypothetical protein
VASSATELEIIDDTIRALSQRISPPRLAGKLRFVCEIDGHSASIIEERPPWEGSGEWTRMPCAKFRYVRTQAMWTLYWMRRDRKWHVYDPETKKRDLPTLVRVVEEDKYGAFFG